MPRGGKEDDVERLDKTVATFGNMTRSQATRLIRVGQVRVDGALWRDPSKKLSPEMCEVTVEGRVLDCRPHRYIMMNKPQGLLCVSRDPYAETVVDRLPPHFQRRGMFPAGRLDKDTVGLVLLTDDGDYAHRLLAPKKAVFKHYRAVVAGQMEAHCVEAFAAGTTLEDGTRCLPAELHILSLDEFAKGEGAAVSGDDEITHFFRTFSAKYRIAPAPVYGFVDIAIQEGRYHQIKRMCESVGHKVLWLKRVSIGGLLLDQTLAEGDCREMTAEETTMVFRQVEGICAK